jgi:transcriptional regulator GlxA family with amidase domain
MQKKHPVLVAVARKFMEDNFRDNLTLKDISSHCCISEFHFSRIFKRHTCKTPYQYLLSIRLDYAKCLLRNTTRPVTDIASIRASIVWLILSLYSDLSLI